MKDLNILQQALKNRGATFDLTAVFALDEKRKKLQTEYDSLRAEQNKISPAMARQPDILKDLQKKSARLKEIKSEQQKVEAELNQLQLQIPNVPHSSVPIGKSSEDNPVIRTWGKKPEINFKAQDHVALGEKLGILDFERATKIAGSRFAILKNGGAKLERALIQFMLDTHTNKNGYTEILPPFMANADSLTGTGQLPKFEEDLFKTTAGYYLIPTAEVPLTNLYREEILNGEDLPISLTAYTPCFRSEAGSYGKDVKGLIRQHQFNKVELVKFSHPEKSYDNLEKLTADAESILQKLNLHYRVVTLCTGDIGFSAAKTYDIEVWLPGQNAFREISSCSNCEDFQARRANIRFRDKGGKPQYVHTLNGSGLAVGRTLIAILEQYQQKDGSIKIPDALQPYLQATAIT